jgi:hypothetical protein
MSQALLSLLLSVLLVRSHELCRDDIISTLFHILTNNHENNFAHFIQNYFEQSNIQVILNEKYKRLLLENYSRNETVCLLFFLQFIFKRIRCFVGFTIIHTKS